MTPEQIKAQEIIDRHRKILSVYYHPIIDRHRKILSVYYHPIVAKHASFDFAVSDVEDKIALLNEMLETNLHNDFDILNRRGEYLAILQELKNMNQ